MFYPLPILIYIIEIVLVFGIKSKLTNKQRALISAGLVIISALFFQWLLVND